MSIPHARPRVVLADDYPRLLIVLETLLAPTCDVVALVRDSTDLLAIAGRLRPDVVVMDVQMPVNGVQVCRHIKDVLPGTNVILMTADDDSDIRDKAFAAGASAFIPKHRIGVDLVRAIKQAFSCSAVLEHC
jgi:DNA-binding NarL/FixJ family response regulator